MKIEHYIAQLLFRHQCVTVPGFGAFLTEIQSAQFNEVSNTFTPPKKLVSFNQHLKNNDGLLANHISVTEKIDYQAAVDKISEEVDSWKERLETYVPVLFNGIGVIRMTAEGTLLFETYNHVNYLAEAFGLSSFVSPYIKREEKQEEVAVAIEEAEEPAFVLPTIVRKVNYLKYAAIFVVGLGTAGFFGYNAYQHKIAADTQLVQTEVQKEVQNKIQEATFFISNPLPNVSLTVENTKTPYHIMAGSFRDESNADKIYDRLIKAGYKAQKIEKTKFGLYPVIYGSYSNYNEAQKSLEEIKKSENPDAWLLIKDL